VSFCFAAFADPSRPTVEELAHVVKYALANSGEFPWPPTARSFAQGGRPLPAANPSRAPGDILSALIWAATTCPIAFFVGKTLARSRRVLIISTRSKMSLRTPYARASRPMAVRSFELG
jgi:hypothetical protein